MKSAFITFLIISFIGVAVFGFLSMIFGNAHGYGCIASNRLGTFCPLTSAFDFVVFHIDAFKYFSTAVLGAVLLILLSGMAFSVLPRPLNNDEEDDAFAAVRIRESSRMTRIVKKIDFNNWLSLHINSPAFISAAA